MSLRRGWPGGALACALAVSAVLGACAADGSGGGPDLAGKVFVATEVTGYELVDGSTLRLTFEDRSVSAQAGCNTIFGAATWDDGTLTPARELARTSMGCVEGLAEQDDWLSEFLAAGPSIELDGTTLTLDDGRATITLEQE